MGLMTFVGDGFEPFFMLSFRLLLLQLLLSFAAYLLMNDKTFSYFFLLIFITYNKYILKH